jgi:hypothetical protein
MGVGVEIGGVMILPQSDCEGLGWWRWRSKNMFLQMSNTCFFSSSSSWYSQWIVQGLKKKSTIVVVGGAHAGSSVHLIFFLHLKAVLNVKNRAWWCCLAELQPALYGRLEGWQ